jgi:UDP-N-acetylglucosamine transferase subunit ALG13
VIFVTVGGQTPFDRLIRAVDHWAISSDTRHELLFQIGSGSYVPASGKWVRFLSAPEFKSTVVNASLIIAHAGMGSILTALEVGKPILVMPRRARLRETRNDHQIATANALKQRGQVYVAADETELGSRLDSLGNFRACPRVSPWANDDLLAAIREFIWNGETRRVHSSEDGLPKVS